MEIKNFIDHLQFGKHYVYLIDKHGDVIEKTEHTGNVDIYFVSADLPVKQPYFLLEKVTNNEKTQ